MFTQENPEGDPLYFHESAFRQRKIYWTDLFEDLFEALTHIPICDLSKLKFKQIFYLSFSLKIHIKGFQPGSVNAPTLRAANSLKVQKIISETRANSGRLNYFFIFNTSIFCCISRIYWT